MTPDEIAKLIPDEVVEAAAKVIASVNEPIDKWIYHTPETRSVIIAALAAGIAAWPGGVQNYNWDGSRSRIVLPIKTEGV